MNDIAFEVLKLLVMLVIAVIALIGERYAVPLLQAHMDETTFEAAKKWASLAVLSAQQVLKSQSGSDRKAYVTKYLKDLLTAKNISLTDEQIDILIESAVKEMKMQENRSRKEG